MDVRQAKLLPNCVCNMTILYKLFSPSLF